MEYEILVEKNSNGRVIVDFYGIDFDITDEFVNGKCHKVIFGDQIVFVLKGAEIKEELVENSNTTEETSETHEEVPEPEHPEAPEEKHDETTEESEKHDEPEHSEEAIEYSPVETPEAEATDNHVGTSEEVHNEEKPVENPENLVVAPEEEHTPVETEDIEEAGNKRGKKAKEEAAEEN
jgi:hypothetical protein